MSDHRRPHDRDADPAPPPVRPPEDGAGLLRLQNQAGNQAVVRAVVQRDLVDDVRGLLSYGAFDWAITDADASRAFHKLIGLPQDQLPGAVSRLGHEYCTRLLDNLPDSLRRWAAYSRLVATMGPSIVESHVTSLLSYGVFDWVVTDRDVTLVMGIFQAFSPTQKEDLLRRLGAGPGLSRLAANATADQHQNVLRPWIAALPRAASLTEVQKRILKQLFDGCGDAQTATMVACLERRFGVPVGAATRLSAGQVGASWDRAGLVRLWPVLESLPAAHLAGNASLNLIGRYTKAGESGISGVYGGRQARILYDNTSDTQESDPGDSLRGVNRFDKVVRHEVGHAVDVMIGWATGGDPATDARGGWTNYGAMRENCARDMVAASGGAVTTVLTDAQRRDVIAQMVTAMTAHSAAGLRAALQGLPWWGTLSDRQKADVLADPALRALPVAMDDPWYNAPDGGTHLGDHVYQESYPNTWVRYKHARRAFKVSQYQFRAPGEWFAEAYAAYYEPDPRGRGQKLNDRDADTKAWFDTNVHAAVATRPTGNPAPPGPAPGPPPGPAPGPAGDEMPLVRPSGSNPDQAPDEPRPAL